MVASQKLEKTCYIQYSLPKYYKKYHKNVTLREQLLFLAPFHVFSLLSSLGNYCDTFVVFCSIFICFKLFLATKIDICDQGVPCSLFSVWGLPKAGKNYVSYINYISWNIWTEIGLYYITLFLSKYSKKVIFCVPIIISVSQGNAAFSFKIK